jgi:hypothetical protein
VLPQQIERRKAATRFRVTCPHAKPRIENAGPMLRYPIAAHYQADYHFFVVIRRAGVAVLLQEFPAFKIHAQGPRGNLPLERQFAIKLAFPNTLQEFISYLSMRRLICSAKLRYQLGSDFSKSYACSLV